MTESGYYLFLMLVIGLGGCWLALEFANRQWPHPIPCPGWFAAGFFAWFLLWVAPALAVIWIRAVSG